MPFSRLLVGSWYSACNIKKYKTTQQQEGNTMNTKELRKELLKMVLKMEELEEDGWSDENIVSRTLNDLTDIIPPESLLLAVKDLEDHNDEEVVE